MIEVAGGSGMIFLAIVGGVAAIFLLGVMAIALTATLRVARDPIMKVPPFRQMLEATYDANTDKLTQGEHGPSADGPRAPDVPSR